MATAVPASAEVVPLPGRPRGARTVYGLAGKRRSWHHRAVLDLDQAPVAGPLHHAAMARDITRMEFIMFKTILVPTDGSPLAEKAADAAIRFASAVDSRVIAVSVAEPAPLAAMADGIIVSDLEAYEAQARQLAQEHVARVAAAAEKAGVRCETTTAVSFNPAEEIVGAANKFGCDAIFMASHGRTGLQRLMLGSETQKVLAHTTLPVLVIR